MTRLGANDHGLNGVSTDISHSVVSLPWRCFPCGQLCFRNGTRSGQQSWPLNEVRSPNSEERVEQSREIRQQARVLLVGHSDLVLQRLKATLSMSSRLVVVGAADTQSEAGALLRTCQPDVVVLDTEVGCASGVEICRSIRKTYPRLAVLFFTANDDKRLLRSAILAGAQGYLLKRASGDAVAKAIEIVAAGQAIMDPQLTQEIFEWIRDKTRPVQRKKMDDCSEFDNRVLALIAAGRSNQEIAHRLNVTSKVLLARLRIIYKRLNVSRKEDAASYFAQRENGR